MKRILSIILATVLIISLIPAVFAADEVAEGIVVKYDLSGFMKKEGYEQDSGKLLSGISIEATKGLFGVIGAKTSSGVEVTTDAAGDSNYILYRSQSTDAFQYTLRIASGVRIAFKVYVPIAGVYKMRVNYNNNNKNSDKVVYVYHIDDEAKWADVTVKDSNSKLIADGYYKSGGNTNLSPLTVSAIESGSKTTTEKEWTLSAGYNVFTFLADSSECSLGTFELYNGSGTALVLGNINTTDDEIDIEKNESCVVTAEAILSNWDSWSGKAGDEPKPYYKESTFTYSSSDPDIASVEKSTGKVTAIKPGTVTITATSNEATVENTLTTQITVVDPNAPTEDEELKTAFTIDDTDDIEKAVYTDKVSALAYVDGAESTDGVTAKAEQLDTGAYRMTTSTTADTKYTFLYWVKGLDGGAKKVVSREESFTYTPAGNGANYLIAVYEKDGAAANKAEFYDANGLLIKAIEGTMVVTPDLPSMAGYGDAQKWVNKNGDKYDGNTSVDISGTVMFIAEYAEPMADIVVTPLNGSCTVDKEEYAYGEKVVCTPTATKNFKAWVKDGEIVSVDAEKYEFYAWENCEVEAIYEEHTPISGVARKIIIDLFGNNIMAEYIGFGDAVEKGIILDNTEIAMTSTKTQFTIALDNATSAKGYAVVKNSDGTYTKYIDGSYTKQAE